MTKPRIKKTRDRFMCVSRTVDGKRGRSWVGYGDTPREAYASWLSQLGKGMKP